MSHNQIKSKKPKINDETNVDQQQAGPSGMPQLTETEQQRRTRLIRSRETYKLQRASETSEQREIRLKKQREKDYRYRNLETPQRREYRLSMQRMRTQETRNNETTERREERLNRQRIRAEQRRASETAQQREERLSSQRIRDERNRGDENVVEINNILALRNSQYNLQRRANLQGNVGNLNKLCSHCKAKLFVGETAHFCCMNGKVRLPKLHKLPHELYYLYADQGEEARHFRRHLRQYNSLFQMTSFGCKEIKPQHGWNPSIVIQGQIHHYIGSLLPEPDNQAQFIQIYFLDKEYSIDVRMNMYPNIELRRNIIENIEYILRRANIYVTAFQQTKDMIYNIPNAVIVIDPTRKPINEYERRYNNQIFNEVGIIIQNNNEQQTTSRHIILREKGGQLQTISEYHRSYDPLQYVLFFPDGEDGWHPEMTMTNNRKLTAMRYYAYRIMIRDDEFNQILRGGRLFQQYVVDMAGKIEVDRLNYIRLNQSSLRSTTYRGFVDALHDNDDLSNIGRKVILSSTFVGGPRYMMERCQDAMMYVRKYGTATYFITMTCNPNWPEIKDNLIENQFPHDRPDIIARIFDLKRKLFIKYLTGTQGLLGNCIAYVISVEYQKRGLPHLHCLLWMEEESKPRPQNYDDFVQAEIPNKVEHPEEHELVLTHMIHGPNCNSTSLCWKNGSCSKRYPKPYSDETRCGYDSYPIYRRRSPEMGGHQGYKEGRNEPITSKWVVPYNMTLLKLFNCHLNVEICTSVKSIKYVIKYTLKGSDQAVFSVSKDEIKQYLTGRYIGPSEAVSMILGFPIHVREPAVVRLQIHLPDQHMIYIQRTSNRDLNRNASCTTLTEFFNICQNDEFARTLYYSDVPKYYVWQNKKWQRRKMGRRIVDHPGVFEANILGRMYTVSPNSGELYFLRLLLHHVKGPNSFESLRTVAGHICPLFKTACKERGLLLHDNHWIQTMEDADKTRMPRAIRDLFIVILLNTECSNPLELWERFSNSMAMDYYNAMQIQVNNQNMVNKNAINNTLRYINDKLCAADKSLQDFGLPLPQNLPNVIHINRAIMDEQSYNIAEQMTYVKTHQHLLNDEQSIIYNFICSCLNTDSSSLIFIDAPGGTGKTFLIKLLLSKVRSLGQIALAVASSGIAATLMPGGRTAHSRFKLPLNVRENDVCNFDKQSETANLIRAAKLIIWDECPMIRRESLETFDRTLKDICGNNETFGGILTVCSGDFRQLLPVIKRGNDADIYNACIKESFLWRKFKKFYLKQNMRVQDDDDEYSKFIIKIGEDKLEKNENGEIELPEDLIIRADNVDQCIEYIYPSFDNLEMFAENCILVPFNDTVRAINHNCIEKFPGQVKEYLSFNSVLEGTEATHYPTEFLDSIELSGLPPHKLELKKGAPIICMRNIDPPRLCNGTRLIIEELYNNLIVAKIIASQFEGEIVLIPRLKMVLSEGDNIPFARVQFPIQLAFAMTIHKSQGQTLHKVLVYLDKPVFQHGQLYVALSRVKRKENIKVFLKHSNCTKNVVNRKVLS